MKAYELQETLMCDSKKKKKNQVHKCSYEGCSAVFTRLWRLKAHISVHKGEKPYQCDVEGCDKAYTNLPHLKRHQNIQHSDTPPAATLYPCLVPFCGMVLKTRQNLLKHTSRVHGEKKFKCLYCEESFSEKSRFDAHVFHHSGKFPHKCSECNVGFFLSREFNRHQRKHNLHLCPHRCEKVFTDYKILRRHIADDHAQCFQCEYCLKIFKNKMLLKTHVKKIHLPPERQPLLSKLLYQCNKCPKAHTSKKNFINHMKNIHNTLLDPKIRTPRRDKGIQKGPIKSLASVLSSVELSEEVEEFIIQKDLSCENVIDPF